MNLPPETWTEILRFACEDNIDLDANLSIDWSTERRTVCGYTEFKLPYSLVSRAFRDMMEHILYEFIWISRPTSAVQLADFFDRKLMKVHPEDIGARTRVLVLRHSFSAQDGARQLADFEDFCAGALRILRNCQHLTAFSMQVVEPTEELEEGVLRTYRAVRAEIATLVSAYNTSITHFAWMEFPRWAGYYESGAWLASLLARMVNLRFMVFCATGSGDFEHITRIAPRLECLTHLAITACLDDIWFIDTWDLPALQNLVLACDPEWYDEQHVVTYRERPSLRSIAITHTTGMHTNEYIARTSMIAPNLTGLAFILPELSSNWTGEYQLETLKIDMSNLGFHRSGYENYELFEEELMDYFDRLQGAHSSRLRLIILYGWPDNYVDLSLKVVNALAARFEDNESIQWIFDGYVDV